MKRALKSIGWYVAFCLATGLSRFHAEWRKFKGDVRNAWRNPA